jgi:hypothetical protein
VVHGGAGSYSRLRVDPEYACLPAFVSIRPESEFVKLGQYHSLELALQRNFTLSKPNWDSIYLERIDIACDLKHSAEIGAVVMQPGLANVCLGEMAQETESERKSGESCLVLSCLTLLPSLIGCLSLRSDDAHDSGTAKDRNFHSA